MNCRVYPIRLTRNSWNIPIYGIHQCSDRCNLVLIPNPENPHYLTLQKISESCQMKNLIESTLITINDFDIFNPNTTSVASSLDVVVGLNIIALRFSTRPPCIFI